MSDPDPNVSKSLADLTYDVSWSLADPDSDVTCTKSLSDPTSDVSRSLSDPTLIFQGSG